MNVGTSKSTVGDLKVKESWFLLSNVKSLEAISSVLFTSKNSKN